MQIFELKCFGTTPGSGNTALVIEGHRGDAGERQQLASDWQKCACAFLDPLPDGGWQVDYFYPHMRSPLCLHATLAAAHVLFARQGDDAPITLRTALRGQQLRLSRTAQGYGIGLARQPLPRVAIAPGLAAALLGPCTLVSAPALASVGSPKLLLEVDGPATLRGLAPDLAAISAWGQANGVSGCYVYCRRADGSYEGRNFNHLDPRLEDSATGVAAGALTVHLGRALQLHQGGNCRMETAIDGDLVTVGGKVEAAT
jgi:predicted PhzF superfamily epimerase YddE/YHI9